MASGVSATVDTRDGRESRYPLRPRGTRHNEASPGAGTGLESKN